MENVVLIIHLILALSLIGTVLLQRSEGGGLGMGGGGSTANSRPPASAISKFTWMLAAAFIATSITLTLIAAGNTAGSSVADRVGGADLSAPVSVPDLGESLLPPSPAEEPLLPAGD
ncbi:MULTISPECIES: preprotein translocase subunit SecG [unclassified Yoonia]|uniref:preprotein translocase subunit SecG n=1 Tax=unclassified Yoonia TaxID=2629118 RepID=UPI002AFECFCE|nr:MULTISPECIES: preprotein translocase subunit SecG [unclassified Yoonia]